jgi:hypothetical protein
VSEDVRSECERLFMACAPFVRAESEAEESLLAAQAALKTARIVFKAAQKAAALKRAAWVDYLLTHDHKALCYQECRTGRPAPREDEP